MKIRFTGLLSEILIEPGNEEALPGPFSPAQHEPRATEGWVGRVATVILEPSLTSSLLYVVFPNNLGYELEVSSSEEDINIQLMQRAGTKCPHLVSGT